MNEIRMVDLKGQYQKIKSEVDSAIQSVLDSTAFIFGPDVSAFQKELAAYLNCKHVIACANGTDALQVSLMALDLQQGDEVITSPFTFISSIEMIRLLGLKPVLVDVEEDTFNINSDLIEKAISDRTKVLLPVHLFGQCANMSRISEIAEGNELFTIEDNAQALGAEYSFADGMLKKAGTMSDIGTTSFFPSKNLGCYGDGGAIFTDNENLSKKITALVNHGMKRQYYYDYIGVNSRLDSIQAAVLRIKLKHLDTYNNLRRKAANFYDEAFSVKQEIKVPVRSSFSSHIFHQYTMRVPEESRDQLHEYLRSLNIPAAIYYPVPLHLQTAYLDLGYNPGDLPVSEKLSKQVISLPMHTELDDEQLEFITESVVNFFN